MHITISVLILAIIIIITIILITVINSFIQTKPVQTAQDTCNTKQSTN